MSTQSIAATSNPLPMSLVAMGNTEPAETSKVPTQLKHLGQRRDYQMIDPRNIDIESSFNPRNYTLPENRAHIDELKESIAERVKEGKRGLILPVVVRFHPETKRATVVDGECRLRAILELIAEGNEILAQADVPCFPDDSKDEIERRFTALVANTGKPLSQWEQGGAFAILYNMGISHEKIAAKVGVTAQYVRKSIELADAPEDVKKMLSERAVTPAHALQIIRAVDTTAAVAELQAQVRAKQEAGEKGPVKRAKARANVTAPPSDKPSLSERILISDMKAAILALIENLSPDDLNENIVDGEDLNAYVYVDRVKLLKLANFVVND